jgi:glycosyltransferase involved in cell wall biosynthesis
MTLAQRHKLAILFVTPHLEIGGEELSTMGLVEGMRERGHSAFYMSTTGPMMPELQARKIDYLTGQVNGRGLVGILKGARSIRKALVEHSIDIVHASQPRTAMMGFWASRSVYPRNTKVIWHDRGTMNHALSAKLFSVLADFVVTNSRSERQLLVDNGLPSHKVRAVHNFMYLPPPEAPICASEVRPQWGLEDDAPVIGCVARLVSVKGHQYLLEAARTVLSEVPQARFLIVGDGPLRAELEQMAEELGIERHVIFTGFLRDEIPSLYACMDLLALPSTYESFGNVSMEAMSFKTAVVASDTGGIPEVVIDGETGLLVPPRDPDSLAKALLTLLKDKSLRQRMGAAGCKRVRGYFTRDRAVDELEEVYASLLSDRAGSFSLAGQP